MVDGDRWRHEVAEHSAPTLMPLVTLLAGLTTGIVLLALAMNAAPARPSGAPATDAGRPGPSVAAASSPAAPVTSGTSAPPERIRATYAGHTTTGDASIALAIRDGHAIAYVCDGDRLEAWLTGTAAAGQLSMKNVKNTARLQATFGPGTVSGAGTVGDRRITFEIRQVKRPSGLYRFTGRVRNAKVVGGWIVLADGTQVGVVATNGTPSRAPQLDTATGSAAVAGTPVVANPIDGVTGSGI